MIRCRVKKSMKEATAIGPQTSVGFGRSDTALKSMPSGGEEVTAASLKGEKAAGELGISPNMSKEQLVDVTFEVLGSLSDSMLRSNPDAFEKVKALYSALEAMKNTPEGVIMEPDEG